MAEVQSVDIEHDYIHVRFNDPDRYETIRTPDWAETLPDRSRRTRRFGPANG